MTLGDTRIRRGRRCPSAPAVSVVIPVVRDTAEVIRCLDSIAATTTVDAELVVVANGTKDRALEPLAGREDHVLLRLWVNAGFAAACNLGARVGRADRIVFLNDDTVVQPGWLEALIAAAGAGVGIVGSLLLFPDGEIQDAGGILWSDATTMRAGWHQRDLTGAEATLHDVDYCTGCSMLVPRDVWERMHGFDERYFPAYYEDVDLCMRIHDSGLRVLCEPRSRVIHNEHRSSTDVWREYLVERNRERFAQRWHAELSQRPARVEPDAPGIAAAVALALQRAAVAPL